MISLNDRTRLIFYLAKKVRQNQKKIIIFQEYKILNDLFENKVRISSSFYMLTILYKTHTIPYYPK